MTNLKYSVGIDIAKDEFKACLSVIDSQQKVTVKSTCTFKNTSRGFDEFCKWFTKHKREELPINFLMEATGIYYEQLAWYLHNEDCSLSVILPNKAKKYIQGLGVKSKNDKIDAKGLAKMGAEQSLPLWKPITKTIYQLRALTRLHEDLSLQRTATLNRLKTLDYSMHNLKAVKKSMQKVLRAIEKEIAHIESEIKSIVNHDAVLKSKYEKIGSIQGVGLLTFAVVVSETNGFELFTSRSQLTSYAGYDISENQSGTKTGKTRISKKGNAHIRRVLHLPAFVVVKYQPCFKSFYERIYSNTKIKMKAYVAVQRKLLCLIYTLWKNDAGFNPRMNDDIQRQESQILFG
jgi:transposase